jgi:hypothetical protein
MLNPLPTAPATDSTLRLRLGVPLCPDARGRNDGIRQKPAAGMKSVAPISRACSMAESSCLLTDHIVR